MIDHGSAQLGVVFVFFFLLAKFEFLFVLIFFF